MKFRLLENSISEGKFDCFENTYTGSGAGAGIGAGTGNAATGAGMRFSILND